MRRIQFARAGFEDLLKRVPRLRCSGNRSAWGSDQLQFRSSLLDPYGGGNHIDRTAFDEALLAQAVCAGAQLLRGVRPRAWARRLGGWQVALPAPVGAVNCDAIVDCTGRRAVFARSQGARRVAVDRQIAIVTLLSASSDPDLSTTIEAAEIGWWYSAQVPSGRQIVALFSDIDLLPGLEVKSIKGVAKLIEATRHISALVNSGAAIEGPSATVLADTAYLTTSAGDGWCAAGDAAVSFDPLASMGIVNAVKAGSHASRLVMAGFCGCRGYSDTIVESATSHFRDRLAYYQMESRWPGSLFWVRRQRER